MNKESELKVYDSQFTLNSASSGGSLAVVVGDSIVESCNFTSDTASEAGGCILLKAANGTVKQSHFSGCASKSGGAVTATKQATLLLQVIMIHKSYSSDKGGALYISYNSDLSVRNSVITDSRSKYGGGIYCSDRSQMYLDSVLIKSCSMSLSGCVYSQRCSVTMDNITITDVSSVPLSEDLSLQSLFYFYMYNDVGPAMEAWYSTIDIYNTMAQDDAVQFLRAVGSHVNLWNLNISGMSIDLRGCVAEFRHTLIIMQDGMCLFGPEHIPLKLKLSPSSINLKSVYITGPKNGIVCERLRDQMVVYGNVSGRSFHF